MPRGELTERPRVAAVPNIGGEAGANIGKAGAAAGGAFAEPASGIGDGQRQAVALETAR